MSEKINPETKFIIKIYTFEYYVKFSFWVSIYDKYKLDILKIVVAVFLSACLSLVNTVISP